MARRRSFAGADKDVGVSTSTLSQSVRQLEARLGVALLARTGNTGEAANEIVKIF